MPPINASEIILSEKQRQILTGFAKSTHQPLHLKIRAEIVLRASDGYSNNAIGQIMGIGTKRVRRWRNKYSKNREQLSLIET